MNGLGKDRVAWFGANWGAATLAALLTATNVVFPHAIEANVWKERADHRRLAALSAAPAVNPLPTSLRHAKADARIFARPIPNEPLQAALTGLPARLGTVRSVALPRSGSAMRVVVHIQDVHGNVEAQTNIGRVVERLAAASAVDLVALEGASGPIDLAALRRHADRDAVRRTADYLFRTGAISGPIHRALRSDGLSTPFTGVEDADRYRANVGAARAALRRSPSARAALRREREANRLAKAAAFEGPLSRFDAGVEAFHARPSALGAYVRHLTAFADAVPDSIRSFARVVEWESALDFARVEAERSRFLAALAPRLDGPAWARLTEAAAAYRLGALTHARFYGAVRSAAGAAGISLARFPHFDAYIRYVLSVDAIDADRLFDDLAVVERSTYDRLAATPLQRTLVDESARLFLAEKLAALSLTSREWRALQRSESAGASDGSPFERFYREAESRDEAMARNLVNAMERHGANAAVLIAGGFHADGVRDRLLDAGIAVVGWTPRLSKAPEGAEAAYLSVFAQERTPLDRLIHGDALFLATPPMIKTAAAMNLIALAGDRAAHAIRRFGGHIWHMVKESPKGAIRRVWVERSTAERAALLAEDLSVLAAQTAAIGTGSPALLLIAYALFVAIHVPHLRSDLTIGEAGAVAPRRAVVYVSSLTVGAAMLFAALSLPAVFLATVSPSPAAVLAAVVWTLWISGRHARYSRRALARLPFGSALAPLMAKRAPKSAPEWVSNSGPGLTAYNPFFGKASEISDLITRTIESPAHGVTVHRRSENEVVMTGDVNVRGAIKTVSVTFRRPTGRTGLPLQFRSADAFILAALVNKSLELTARDMLLARETFNDPVFSIPVILNVKGSDLPFFAAASLIKGYLDGLLAAPPAGFTLTPREDGFLLLSGEVALGGVTQRVSVPFMIKGAGNSRVFHYALRDAYHLAAIINRAFGLTTGDFVMLKDHPRADAFDAGVAFSRLAADNPFVAGPARSAELILRLVDDPPAGVTVEAGHDGVIRVTGVVNIDGVEAERTLEILEKPSGTKRLRHIRRADALLLAALINKGFGLAPDDRLIVRDRPNAEAFDVSVSYAGLAGDNPFPRNRNLMAEAMKTLLATPPTGVTVTSREDGVSLLSADGKGVDVMFKTSHNVALPHIRRADVPILAEMVELIPDVAKRRTAPSRRGKSPVRRPPEERPVRPPDFNEPVRPGEMVMNATQLAETFVGSPKKLRDALSFLGPVPPATTVTVLKTVDGEITFTSRLNKSARVWTMKGGDLDAFGRHAGLVKYDEAGKRPDEIAVVPSDIKAPFYGSAVEIVDQINGALGGRPTGNQMKRVIGERIEGELVFTARQIGRHWRWTFKAADRARVAAHFDLLLRTDAAPPLSSGEIAINRRGLTGVFTKEGEVAAEAILKLIAEAPTFRRRSLTIGSGANEVEIFTRRRGKNKATWAFHPADTAKLAAIFGWTVALGDIPPLNLETEAPTSASGREAFVGGQQSTAFTDLLGEVPEFAEARFVTRNGETVEFFVRQNGPKRVWAFKKSDLERVATLTGLTLRSETPAQDLKKGEIAVTNVTFPRLFVGNAAEMVQAVKERAGGEPPDADKSVSIGTAEQPVVLTVRRRGTRVIWAFPDEQLDALAATMGFSLRANLLPPVDEGAIVATPAVIRRRFLGDAESVGERIARVLGDPPVKSEVREIATTDGPLLFSNALSGSNPVWTFDEGQIERFARHYRLTIKRHIETIAADETQVSVDAMNALLYGVTGERVSDIRRRLGVPVDGRATAAMERAGVRVTFFVRRVVAPERAGEARPRGKTGWAFKTADAANVGRLFDLTFREQGMVPLQAGEMTLDQAASRLSVEPDAVFGALSEQLGDVPDQPVSVTVGDGDEAVTFFVRVWGRARVWAIRSDELSKLAALLNLPLDRQPVRRTRPRGPAALPQLGANEVGLTGPGLIEFFVGAMDKLSAVIQDAVGPAPDQPDTRIIEKDGERVTIFNRLNFTRLIWAVARGDLDAAGRIFGLKRREGGVPPPIGDDEIAVSQRGVADHIVGGQSGVLETLRAALGDPPESAATQTLGEGEDAVTFATRKTGEKTGPKGEVYLTRTVWAFPAADLEKLSRQFGFAIRRGEVPLLDRQTEALVTGPSLKSFVRGRVDLYAKDLQERLGPAHQMRLAVTLTNDDGKEMAFFTRGVPRKDRTGRESVRTFWAFKKADGDALAAFLGAAKVGEKRKRSRKTTPKVGGKRKRDRKATPYERSVAFFGKHRLLDLAVVLSSNPEEMQQALAILLTGEGVDLTDDQLRELNRSLVLNLREGHGTPGAPGFTPGNPFDYLRSLMALQAQIARLDEHERFVLIRAFVRLAYPYFARDYDGAIATLEAEIAAAPADSLPFMNELLADVKKTFGEGLAFQPAHVTTPLLPHQRVGAWSLRHSNRYEDEGVFGFLLEDDTRMGKTIQAYAGLDPSWKTVIAVPANVMDTWQEQFDQHTDGSIAFIPVRGTVAEKRAAVLGARGRKGVILLVGIEDLRAKPDDEFAALNDGLDLVVIDEGQKIENYAGDAARSNSLQARAVHRLRPSRYWVLSASPYTSHPKQLFSVFNLVHTNPATGEVSNDLFRSPMNFARLLTGSLDRMKWLYALKARIGLRRTKAEMGRMFTKKTEPRLVDFEATSEQSALTLRIIKNLGEYVNEYNARVPASEQIMRRSIGVLLKLQFLNWAMTDPSFLGEDVPTNFWAAMDKEVLPRLEGKRKGIIFAQNTGMIDAIVRRYEAMGHRVARIDGTVSGHAVVDGALVLDERGRPMSAQAYQRRIFQDSPDARLVVMNIRAGIGLNLSAADWELYAQLPSNYVEYYQSSDRALGLNPDLSGETQKEVEVLFMMPHHAPAFIESVKDTPDHIFVSGGTPAKMLHDRIMGDDRARFEMVMEGIRARGFENGRPALARLAQAIRGFLQDPSLKGSTKKHRKEMTASNAFWALYNKVKGDTKSEDGVLQLIPLFAATDVSPNPLGRALGTRADFDSSDLPILHAAFEISNKRHRDEVLGLLPDLYGLTWTRFRGFNDLITRGPPEWRNLADLAPETLLPLIAATRAWNAVESDGTFVPAHPGARVLLEILPEIIDDGLSDFDQRRAVRRLANALMNFIDLDSERFLDFVADIGPELLDSGVSLEGKMRFLEELAVLRQADADAYGRVMARRKGYEDARDAIHAAMKASFYDLFDLPDDEATASRVRALYRDWGSLSAAVHMMGRLKNADAAAFGGHVALFRRVMRHIVDGTYAAWRNGQQGDPTGHEIAFRDDDPTFWRAFTREESVPLGDITVTRKDLRETRAANVTYLRDRLADPEALRDAFGALGPAIQADAADAETPRKVGARIGDLKAQLKRLSTENVDGSLDNAIHKIGVEIGNLDARLRVFRLRAALKKGDIDEMRRRLADVDAVIKTPALNENNKLHVRTAVDALRATLEREGKRLKFENVTVQFTSDPDLIMRRGMLDPELINCFNLHAGVVQIATLVDDLASRNKMLAIVRVDDRVASVAIVKVRSTEEAGGEPVLFIERPLFRWGYHFEREIAEALEIAKIPDMPDAWVAGDVYKGSGKTHEFRVYSTGTRSETEYHETLFGWRLRESRVSHLAGVIAAPAANRLEGGTLDLSALEIATKGGAAGLLPWLWGGVVARLAARGWSGRRIAGAIGALEEFLISGVLTTLVSVVGWWVFGFPFVDAFAAVSAVVAVLFIVAHLAGVRVITDGALSSPQAARLRDVVALSLLSLAVRAGFFFIATSELGAVFGGAHALLYAVAGHAFYNAVIAPWIDAAVGMARERGVSPVRALAARLGRLKTHRAAANLARKIAGAVDDGTFHDRRHGDRSIAYLADRPAFWAAFNREETVALGSVSVTTKDIRMSRHAKARAVHRLLGDDHRADAFARADHKDDRDALRTMATDLAVSRRDNPALQSALAQFQDALAREGRGARFDDVTVRITADPNLIAGRGALIAGVATPFLSQGPAPFAAALADDLASRNKMLAVVQSKGRTVAVAVLKVRAGEDGPVLLIETPSSGVGYDFEREIGQALVLAKLSDMPEAAVAGVSYPGAVSAPSLTVQSTGGRGPLEWHEALSDFRRRDEAVRHDARLLLPAANRRLPGEEASEDVSRIEIMVDGRSVHVVGVGHGNRNEGQMLALLKRAEAAAVVDVRTNPVSRYNAHFNRRAFSASLARAGIAYHHEGAYLGGKYPGYEDAFSRFIADDPDGRFSEGITRLFEIIRLAAGTVVLMCSEKKLHDCHRHDLLRFLVAHHGAANSELNRPFTEKPKQRGLFDDPAQSRPTRAAWNAAAPSSVWLSSGAEATFTTALEFPILFAFDAAVSFSLFIAPAWLPAAVAAGAVAKIAFVLSHPDAARVSSAWLALGSVVAGAALFHGPAAAVLSAIAATAMMARHQRHDAARFEARNARIAALLDDTLPPPADLHVRGLVTAWAERPLSAAQRRQAKTLIAVARAVREEKISVDLALRRAGVTSGDMVAIVDAPAAESDGVLDALNGLAAPARQGRRALVVVPSREAFRDLNRFASRYRNLILVDGSEAGVVEGGSIHLEALDAFLSMRAPDAARRAYRRFGRAALFHPANLPIREGAALRSDSPLKGATDRSYLLELVLDLLSTLWAPVSRSRAPAIHRIVAQSA